MQKPVLDKNAMIKWLGDVIEAEIKKPDNEIDTALIVECSEYLDELLSDIQISDEQMKRNIAKIKNRSCDTTNTASTRHHRRTPRMRRFIAAICAAALLLGGAVSAYAFIPAFRDMIRDVLNLPSGSSTDSEGVTFVNFGEIKKYKDIEELINAEKLDILYPHSLPDYLTIRAIVISEDEKNLTYSISFADDLITMAVMSGEIDTSMISDSSEVYKNLYGVTSYVLCENEVYTSVTIYGGYTYYVTAYKYQHIMDILENLY